MGLFGKKKKKNLVPGIRIIRFGIRLRYLIILSIVMILIISVLTFVMYLNQRNLLEEEKNTKAKVLTHILTGPAEFYLDKTIETTDKELKIKYDTIKTEATNYKNFNDDIVKIILTDQKGKVKFSTDKKDYKQRDLFPYIKTCLNEKDEKLSIYDYEIINDRKNTKNKDQVKPEENAGNNEGTFQSIYNKIKNIISFSGLSKESGKQKLRAITYPVLLHKGNVIYMAKDFHKYYKRYHESAGPRERMGIYNKLWKKYKKTLGPDFDPKKQKKTNSISKKVLKAGDIDFLFLKLFGEIMVLRDRWVKRNERWMFREKWLILNKQQKTRAYINDMPEKAKEINDRIITTMNSVAQHVENVRRLGALAVIFNIDKIQTELDQTIHRVVIIAAIMTLLSLIAYRFLLSFMVQNLKKLEKWALSVSAGNLDSKIVIKTKDEIGRLSDIFNKMIDEITQKYHLEKFVSSSAKSMIGKKSDTSDSLELGGNDRKNLVFLFSDVRGFTAFSEKNTPETVIEVLNFYLDLQATIIVDKKGDIDGFTGDEIMAHFKSAKKIERAIDTAIAIMKAIGKANAERSEKELPIFEVGIGIHAGDSVIGNIGTHFRMDYTCIGDTVNLAARLCSHAKPGEILVSRETFNKAKKKYTTANTSPLAAKGKEKKISIVKIKY